MVLGVSIWAMDARRPVGTAHGRGEEQGTREHSGDSAPALQLVKKVVQSGDTACLQSTLDVFCHEDKQLLRDHCHAQALSILRAQPSGVDSRARTREAIACLSLAIFAAGRNLHLSQGSSLMGTGGMRTCLPHGFVGPRNIHRMNGVGVSC